MNNWVLVLYVITGVNQQDFREPFYYQDQPGLGSGQAVAYVSEAECEAALKKDPPQGRDAECTPFRANMGSIGTLYFCRGCCLAAREPNGRLPASIFAWPTRTPQYMMEILWDGHWLPLDGRGMTYGSGHGVGNYGYLSKEDCLAAITEKIDHARYRCVPYNDSYTDPDDPPSWTLQVGPLPYGGFYTQSECMEMGRYITDRTGDTFECIHS